MFTFVFTVLSFDLGVDQVTQIIQPLIFGLTTTISILYPALRKFILIISSTLLSLMIILYLFNLVDFSNWIGSLGFGMLIIVIFSYFKVLIKTGCIEKF